MFKAEEINNIIEEKTPTQSKIVQEVFEDKTKNIPRTGSFEEPVILNKTYVVEGIVPKEQYKKPCSLSCFNSDGLELFKVSVIYDDGRKTLTYSISKNKKLYKVIKTNGPSYKIIMVLFPFNQKITFGKDAFYLNLDKKIENQFAAKFVKNTESMGIY